MNKKWQENNLSCSDRVFSMCLVLFYYALIINNVLKRLAGISTNIALAVLMVCVLAYCALNYRIIFAKCFRTILMSEALVAVLFLSSWLIYQNPLSVLFSYAYQTVLFVFISAIVFHIDDFGVLLDMLKKHAIPALLILSLIYLRQDAYVYIMSHSYLMLVPTLIHIYSLIQEKKKWCLLVVLYEIITIFLVGSRGPLMVVGLYIVCMVYTTAQDKRVKIAFTGLLAVGALALFVFPRQLWSLLQSMGIESRSIQLLLTNLFYNSGRSALYAKGRELITQSPLWGYGICGDAVHLGSYVHNIWLELQIHFGSYLGIGLFGLLNLIYICALIKTKISPFVLFWICIGYIPLFVSDSYLLSFQFIISVYVCIRANLQPKSALISS